VLGQKLDFKVKLNGCWNNTYIQWTKQSALTELRLWYITQYSTTTVSTYLHAYSCTNNNHFNFYYISAKIVNDFYKKYPICMLENVLSSTIKNFSMFIKYSLMLTLNITENTMQYSLN